MNIQSLQETIDNITGSICSLIPLEERLKVFEEQKILPYYIRGKNKGKIRLFYKIDDRGFEDMWKCIFPYVWKACIRSCNESIDVEDLISEVRFSIYRSLQYYGPVYNNQTFSKRLGLIVNNVLTNEYRRVSRNNIEIQYYDREEFDIILDSNCGDEKGGDDVDFWCSVPNDIRLYVEKIVFEGVEWEELKKEMDEEKIKILIKFVKSLK
jgi:DNA-directed RNA polymerase specialized sigma24 family protein